MDFNQQIIEEFRAHRGRVALFEGGRLLLLTTTGARSGRPHTTPLTYLPDGSTRVLVLGSAGGSPRNPAWFHNLVANPRATVENGFMTYPAVATVLEGEERDAAFARAVEVDPGWAKYETDSGRRLPVVALEMVPAAGPPQVAGPPTFANALRTIHDIFRRELQLIRGEVGRSGATIGAQLRINCLSVCGGLHEHHSREDGGFFGAVEAQHPDLAPVIARLRAEHVRVAELVAELGAAVDGGATGDVAARVERLASELEAHLDYEEEVLIPVLG